MPVIARGLGHRFGDGPLLFRGLDLDLRPDAVYALTGPSGSGKSTLLSILAGWERPAEGRLERPGVETIGWVFQNPFGVARRSALDHVALPLLARGLTQAEARDEARERMARVGLEAVADAPFAQLSGGEAQRLMLARGMAGSPDLLLVDEPTAQLDPRSSDAVNEALSALAEAGTIVVVATHDPRTRDACTAVIDLARAR